MSRLLTVIGGLLVLAGVASVVLFLVAYDWPPTLWVDRWGRWLGWALRTGAIVVGGALLLLRPQRSD